MHELGALEAQARIHLQQERKISPSVPVFPPELCQFQQGAPVRFKDRRADI